MTSKLEQVAAQAIRDAFNTFDCESDEPPAALLARAAIEAYEGALKAEGYVIVPREPTEEMVESGRAATAAFHDIQGSALTVAREKMRRRYNAMIDASLQEETK